MASQRDQRPVIQIKQNIRCIFARRIAQFKRGGPLPRCHQPQAQGPNTGGCRFGLIQHLRPRPHRIAGKTGVCMGPAVQRHHQLRIGQTIKRQGTRQTDHMTAID